MHVCLASTNKSINDESLNQYNPCYNYALFLNCATHYLVLLFMKLCSVLQ